MNIIIKDMKKLLLSMLLGMALAYLLMRLLGIVII